MGIGKRTFKLSILVLAPLAVLSHFIDWRAGGLGFVVIFGNPDFMPVSIVIGGLLGLANINGLIWSLERLLGAQRASSKLVFVSMFRLFILFALIILLTALKLVNFLGLLAGMTVVFIMLVKEALKRAREQGDITPPPNLPLT